jgi:putative transposon-encoded protein
MARKIHIAGGKLQFNDKFETIIEKVVTRFGTGAKVDCPKEYLGRRVYLIVREK